MKPLVLMNLYEPSFPRGGSIHAGPEGGEWRAKGIAFSTRPVIVEALYSSQFKALTWF